MYQRWTLGKSGAPWCHCFAQFIHWPFGDRLVIFQREAAPQKGHCIENTFCVELIEQSNLYIFAFLLWTQQGLCKSLSHDVYSTPLFMG